MQTEQAQRKSSEFFSNPDTFMTSLMALAIDEWTTEFMEWDPETIRLEAFASFGENTADVCLDKLQAGITILTTEQFYNDPLVFLQLCNVISGSAASWDAMTDDVTVEEAAWAVMEAGLIDMTEGNEAPIEYSPDVAATIGALLQLEGFTRPPQFLRFALMESPALPMDQASEAARQERHRRLEEELVSDLSEKVQSLNQELGRLPISTNSRQTSGEPRDYMRELAARGREPRRGDKQASSDPAAVRSPLLAT